MLLNLVQRWILSPLQACESPMVEDWGSCAKANGCSDEQVAQVQAKAEELYPSYELPICRQYCQRYDAPFHGNGFAIVFCELDVTHLAAAQKDSRLLIFNSLDDALNQDAINSHAHLAPDLVPDPAVAQNAQQPQKTLRDLIAKMTSYHAKFCAAE